MLKARLMSLRMGRFMNLGFTQSILIATILILILVIQMVNQKLVLRRP